ncbi:MAG: hypothetical protein GY704_05770 [Phycisphaeraceae bacterium]|nr:hypothetical protein [Phycisphaeraceae bacterium]
MDEVVDVVVVVSGAVVMVAGTSDASLESNRAANSSEEPTMTTGESPDLATLSATSSRSS